MNIELTATRLRQFRGNVPRNVVAEAVGITEYALNSYECAVRIPRDEIKLRLAQYFQTSIEYLFFDG